MSIENSLACPLKKKMTASLQLKLHSNNSWRHLYKTHLIILPT